MRELLHRLFARGLQNIDAQINRRALRQRPALCNRIITKGRAKTIRQPLRIITRHISRRALKRTARQPRNFGLAQSGRRILRATEQRANRLNIKPAHLLQSAQHNGAARLFAHQISAGGFTAQRVENQRADGGAVLGACKAMRLTPRLQCLSGRLVLALNGVQNLDGSGNTSGRGHPSLAIIELLSVPRAESPQRRPTDGALMQWRFRKCSASFVL